jgi:ribose transport system permease protein
MLKRPASPADLPATVPVFPLAGALLLQLITATLIRNNLSDSASRMVAACIILGAVYLQRDRDAT